MSLDWNITACGNTDALLAQTPDGWPVTECMIWLCMIVGVSRITSQDAESTYARIYAWETVDGPISTSGRRVTPDDVRRRVGLSTNASPLSDAMFRKKIMERLHSDAAGKWRHSAE